jgi:aminobenzoyl-glutamate utilization protein B
MRLKQACSGLALVLGSGLLLAGPAPAGADERKDYAFETIDRNAEQIAQIGDAVYFFAEPGMQEFESTKLLKSTMEAAGFTVELGGAGMPTTFVAKWGSGKPVIAISTEIDALPEGSQTPMSIERKPLVAGAPGHMEGHNTHAGVSAGAAYALKRTMERFNIPGTIMLVLGPAEEQLASRPFIVRAGYFKDVDAAFVIHIGENSTTGWGLQNYAAISAKFTFQGRTAHGAVNPWDGRDAVDAVELMDIGFDKLREHLRPTYRAHRTITFGGIQPNIIPDKGEIWWFVRDNNSVGAKETFDKLENIGKGAALMTGTTMDFEVIASAWPMLGNKVLGEAVRRNIDLVGLPKWSDEEVRFAKELQKANKQKEDGLATTLPPSGSRPQSSSSNDGGDVTWQVPAGLISFPSSVPGIQYHAWPAAITPTSSIAHKGMITGAKVLAASMLDTFTSPELLTEARKQFEQDTRDTKYFSLLPNDAKPPIELHKEVMEKFRPEMAKHYLTVSPRFN